MNPWLRISAGDYEGHMGPAGANQLAPLSRTFRSAYLRARPGRVAVLGCATGNGFEHVDPRITRCLVACDISPAYLETACRRHARLGDVLQPICARVEQAPFARESFDFVSAALIFEYAAPEQLARAAADWLAPGGILSVVLQLPRGSHGPVSDTPFASLRLLSDIMRLVDPQDLTAWLCDAGLERVSNDEIPLRYGKAFHAAEFRRAPGGGLA